MRRASTALPIEPRHEVPIVVDLDDAAYQWFAADIAFALREVFGDRADTVDLQNETAQLFINGYRTAFPDLQMSVDDMVAEGDRVAVRWTARGTNTGPLMNMPASGKVATVTGISILTLSGGKVAEQRSNWDTLGMLQQFGVIPGPGQAG